MRKTFLSSLILALLLLAAAAGRAAAAPVGSWRALQSFADISRIEMGGGRVFVLASGNIYSYNPNDGEVLTYSKVETMSDNGVAHIAWNATAKRLMAVYSNGNIDFIDQTDRVTNLSDYYTKTLTTDKTVNALDVEGKWVYMCTAFGLVKVNAAAAEIADTYNLGRNTFGMATAGSMMFAATADGLYGASLADNLADKGVWTRKNARAYSRLFYMNGRLYGAGNGFLDVIDTSTGAFTQLGSVTFSDLQRLSDHVVLSGGDRTYEFWPATGTLSVMAGAFSRCCHDPSSRSYWVAEKADATGAATVGDKLANVTFADGDLTAPQYVVRGIGPDGPLANRLAFMRLKDGLLYGVEGEDYPADVMVYDGTRWSAFDNSFAPGLKCRYTSDHSLDVDPLNPQRVLVGGHTGLYEFTDGRMTRHWDMDNSPLQPTAGIEGDNRYNYTVVYGVAFDAEGTAWVTNAMSKSSSLFSIDRDGNWTAHHKTEFMSIANQSMKCLGQMIFDSNGLMWLTNGNWQTPALLSYNTATDEVRRYDRFVNQDGSELTLWGVKCVAEDADRNIWLGTTAGPLMLSADAVSLGDDTFTQVKVPRNDGTNLADYLLSEVGISKIVVDGANRKWFATSSNGLYLIGSDNITTIQHFTAENSPLLSNEVLDIALNGATGELFVATMGGLCSYMTDSSQPSEKMTKDNVWAYPNPVRPDYSGLVTVTGLTLNADVKIVTSNGSLVAEGRSNGGTFTWDCRDKAGRRVASGVYMVQTATSDGGSGTVCKIAVVN